MILDGKNKVDWSYIHSQNSVILLSTIQSLSRVPEKNWNIFFDMVIIDEVHHAIKERSQYGKLMLKILSPLRFGLTATEPTTSYERLINEGLIGPKLTEITNQEGVQEGILAKPIISLIPVPVSLKIINKCDGKYVLYRKYGITENKIRNSLIVNEAIKSLSLDDIVLIIVENIEHGVILQKLLKSKSISAPFVQGSMNKDLRNSIKEKTKSKINKICICTKVWREGIDIPSLNHIIYCAGLKERKLVKQAIGRGQRTTIGKNKTTPLWSITSFLSIFLFI